MKGHSRKRVIVYWTVGSTIGKYVEVRVDELKIIVFDDLQRTSS